MAKVELRDGKLCIVDDWQTDYNKPERFRVWWPTGIFEHEAPHLVDEEVAPVDGDGGLFRFTKLGGMIRLELDGKTKPCHTDVEHVKRPRWAKSWQRGEWRRWA